MVLAHQFYQGRHSFIMSECQQVFKSPLNGSPSKAMYSFPKTERFHKEQPPVCDKFYEIPSTRTIRSSGFGRANKSALILQATPPPNKYTQKSDFDEKKRGFSFTSRPQSGGIFNKNSENAPGPGTYEAKQPKLEKSVSYSIGKAVSIEHTNQAVGPGKYDISPSITKDGTYYLSKYRNSRCGRIGSAKRWSETPMNRTETSNNKVKPNTPHNVEQLIMGKFRRGSHISFARSERPRICTSTVPGPGSYNLFSDFGARKK